MGWSWSWTRGRGVEGLGGGDVVVDGMEGEGGLDWDCYVELENS